MIEIDLRIQHHFSDGVYAKEMHLPKDHYAVSHKHNYDHLSVLWSGIARVEVDGKEVVHTAPAFIKIKANAEHKITAVDDVIWYCVHAISGENLDEKKIDDVLIKKD